MTQKGKKEAALDVNNAMAQSEAFIIKYKKQLLIALAAVAVVVGGGLAYYPYFGVALFGATRL